MAGNRSKNDISCSISAIPHLANFALPARQVALNTAVNLHSIGNDSIKGVSRVAQIQFVLGGARSGKSAHAEGLAEAAGNAPVYIATAEIFDSEMESRIALHRERRGPHWQLVEAPIALPEAITAADKDGGVLLIDCLSVWITNILVHEHDTDAATEALVSALSSCRGTVILVASETGLGIVPENKLSRRFRDANGRLNQAVAALADEVFFVAAGIALRIKPQQ